MNVLTAFNDPVAIAVALLDDPTNVALFDTLWDATASDATTFSHALVAAQRLRGQRLTPSPLGVRPALPAPQGAFERALIVAPSVTTSSTTPHVNAALGRGVVRRGPRHGTVATGGHAALSLRARLGDLLLVCTSVVVGTTAIAVAVLVLVDAVRTVMQ